MVWGLCGEQADLAIALLHLHGCEQPVYLVGIDGMSEPGFDDAQINHGFVIIGDCSAVDLKKNNAIDIFKTFSKDCIFIDPFLNRMGKVCDLQESLKDFLTIYKMKTVTEIIPMTGLAKQIDTLIARARTLAKLMEPAVTKETELRLNAALFQKDIAKVAADEKSEPACVSKEVEKMTLSTSMRLQ